MKKIFPILEFDDDKPALLEPKNVIQKNDEMPERCIICFFQDVINDLLNKEEIVEIDSMNSEMGKHPIYLIKKTTPAIALFHPGIGAPLAVGMLEETIALGGKKFIACGGAGSLDSSHAMGKIIIPISAIREEGTSYHYMPPGVEVAPTDVALAAVKKTLSTAGIPFNLTKTWTTDAVYRETKGKIKRRKEMGCQCVEMEAAALFAVARFRNVEIAQILYAGDDLSGEFWEAREWNKQKNIRKKLLELSITACSFL